MIMGIVDRVKSRRFYALVTFSIVSLVVVWLQLDPSPGFHQIMGTARVQFRELPNNVPFQVFGFLDRTVNPLEFSELGFGRSSPPSFWNDSVVGRKPVIGSSISAGNWQDAMVFMESVARFMSDYHLVMYDLSRSNESYAREILNIYGAVIWADSSEYFISGNISQTLEQARTVGLAAWTIESPTSVITHPKMFELFNTRKELYFFHRAIETSHLIIFNLYHIHHKIMLPWVKCALIRTCISPAGAKTSGCNFHRRPLFKYSGCHFHDTSAFNVILGQAFQFKHEAYAAPEPLFANLIDKRLAAHNMTHPLHTSHLKDRRL